MPSDAIVHVVDDDEAVRHSLEFLLATVDIKDPLRANRQKYFSEICRVVGPGCLDYGHTHVRPVGD